MLFKTSAPNRKLSVFGALLLAVTSSLFAAPALATTSTVNIVASGGATEGSGWTYSSGEITPNVNVSINASDIAAKLALAPLVVNGARIQVSAGITNTTSNNLTLKSTGNIIVGGGLTLQSQGGDFIFNSDSDANGSGHVRFGWDANCTQGNVLTNGGDIVVGGGANPLTTATAAQNNDQAAVGCPGGTPPLAGAGLYNYNFNAGGGDISIRGGSPNLGSVLSVRAVNIGSTQGVTTTFQTVGSGNITIFGDGSSIGHSNAWGIATGAMNVSTVNGAILIQGVGSTVGPANARGMSIGGASSITSTTGDITLRDSTNGAASGYTGINLGAAITVTTGGNFSVQADEITQGGALALDVATASIVPNSGSSFTAPVTLGSISAANTDSLIIGAAGNTASVTFGQPVTVGGPISVTAATIAVNAALTATGSPIVLNATTAVTQGGSGSFNATGVNILGTATYNLQTLTVNGGVAAQAFALTFDTQGGSAVAASTFPVGGSVTLPAAPTKTGFAFDGWFLAPSGGTALPSIYSPSATAPLTLYAQWSVPTFAVTFDANGGFGSMNNQSAASAAVLTANAFTRNGFTFTGWNTAANGTGTAYADSASFPFTANTTLYAQWISAALSPNVIYQAPSTALPYPQPTRIIPGTAVIGSPVKVSIFGLNMDLTTSVTSSVGTVRVLSKTASLVEIEITDTPIGAGSITLGNSERSLRTDGAFRIIAAAQTLQPTWSSKQVRATFAAGSSRLSASQVSRLQAVIGSADASRPIRVTANVATLRMTAGDRALGLARARAIAAAIRQALPGASISLAVEATDPRSSNARTGLVEYSVLQK